MTSSTNSSQAQGKKNSKKRSKHKKRVTLSQLLEEKDEILKNKEIDFTLLDIKEII